jgi:hypothetical protein
MTQERELEHHEEEQEHEIEELKDSMRQKLQWPLKNERPGHK